MSQIKLRPEVRKFAERMELQLRENDHKGGWLECDVDWLLDRLAEEREEVVTAIIEQPDEIHAICDECADVANFAMMVSDVVYRYGVSASAQQRVQLTAEERRRN